MWKDPNCIRWSCTVCRTFWRWLDSSELNYVRFVSHCVRYVALLVRFVAVFEDDWIRQSLFSKFSKSNSLEFNKILWINFGKIPVTSGTGSDNFDRKFRSDRKWPEFRSVTISDCNNIASISIQVSIITILYKCVYCWTGRLPTSALLQSTAWYFGVILPIYIIYFKQGGAIYIKSQNSEAPDLLLSIICYNNHACLEIISDLHFLIWWSYN